MQKIIISGKFPGINQYVDACRRNRFMGASMKKKAQEEIEREINAGNLSRANGFVYLRYHYFEPNQRRDLDNISGFFHKVFQDALVSCGILENDNWKCVKGFSDQFYIDKENPRIEVEILEVAA